MCTLTQLRNVTENTGSAFKKGLHLDLALPFTGTWNNFSFLICEIGVLVPISKDFCEDELLLRK